jgi:transcriptional regulator NrdR family protein
MKCDTCQIKTRVIDTRNYADMILRLRVCPECQKTYKTCEKLIDDDKNPIIISPFPLKTS